MFKARLAGLMLAVVCLVVPALAGTAMAKEAADIGALRQEAQLLEKLDEASLALMDNDAQQLMLQTFGNQFVPAALANLPDKLLRDQLAALHREGYTFLAAEGTYYLAVDYPALLRAYERTAGPEVRDYLRLQAAETAQPALRDGGLVIGWHELGRRALAAEGFLRHYPESYRRSQVSDLFVAYASAFLFGVDNTPAWAGGALRPEAADAWARVAREHRDAWLAGYVRAARSAAQKPAGERFADEKALRARLLVEIYPEHRGVYSGERGQATLLLPDGGLLLVEDRVGVAAQADWLLNGDDAGRPVLMTLRGAVNRALPEAGLASFYKQVLVADRVSEASHWLLDDPAMPFALAGVGTEPFWHLRVLENGFVFFSALGEPVQLFASPVKETLADGFRYVLKRPDGAALEITAQWVAGGVGDGMSDNLYPCRVTVVINGKTLKGSGFTQTEKVRKNI